MNYKNLKVIYIPEKLKNNFYVKEAIKKFSDNSQIIYLKEIKEIRKFFDELDIKKKFEIGKETLLFLEKKGRILKPCPGTHNLRCCNYTVLDTGLNCPFDCQYCFLQFYLNFYPNILFVNIEKKLNEKINFFKKAKKYIRIGTGEFIDSLVFDDLIPFSKILINFFKDYKNIILEFKTKSNKTENLLRENPYSNIVVSYSLNSEKIINLYELKTTTLSERIKCLKILSEYGYKVGIHFDPIFYYKDCFKDYSDMFEQIFNSQIKENSICWISLGTFRFNSKLKPIVKIRFKETEIFTGEFVQCADEKFRYFQKNRIKIYNFFINQIRKKYPKVFIYLCMESPTVWKNTLGWFPESDKMLANAFFEN
ncbi:MAG TPA: hypothetical protein PLD27_00735 [bacterium]|nr:hypothetical protein [bacterium]HOL46921.1 hypothetical protein [bacterium]HPQ18317.1 hypothetical protein [bacterium]